MNETTDSAARRETRTVCAAHIYPHGTITDRGHMKKKASAVKRPKRKIRPRSAITTFSRASASRLRRLLIQVCGPEGWRCFGLTLTVPGPPITDEEWRKIWACFRHKMKRLGNLALVWRIELQKRGQPHIHCICWGKNGQGRIREYWDDALALLGPLEGPVNINYESTITCGADHGELRPGWASVTTRWMWPGAREHAVRVDSLYEKDPIGWWRYIASHASKAKQSQLGWKGRQWGVMNGGLIGRDKPVLVQLSERALVKASRYLQRLTKSRFVSSHGRQSWFANPVTVQRVFEWAKAEVPM
jgi:hypothetical protein